jgi:hypothetical protein
VVDGTLLSLGRRRCAIDTEAPPAAADPAAGP